MSVRTPHKFTPLAIIILAIIGVAVTEVSLQYSMIYWASSFVLFGLLFSFQAKVSDQPSNVVQHLLHWSGALIALALVFLFMRSGRLDASQAGSVALLVLALSVFTDGLRIHYRYAVVGVYLFLTTAIMAYVESYLWWFLLISIVVIVFEVIAIKRASLSDSSVTTTPLK